MDILKKQILNFNKLFNRIVKVIINTFLLFNHFIYLLNKNEKINYH